VSEAELREMFMDMDGDASGGVDKEEIGALAIRLGASLTPAELDEAMREVAPPLSPPPHGGFAVCSQGSDGL
jgi:Ca2+-binding EF-hand superfamily protein